ncbi:hypothetical protein [Morganella psychrotolerans]|uniref:Uncharacterized protein n=1 Tax=Morganella psychrotolerans TaxID=368603 RepID=A0A1B8HK33_9GAMM|nr:hypothetical protein [Morganella psychrotolerans]OBU09379.1 hypothetical protein AYY18_19580 [Morganella psychrotolerans]
MKRKIIKRVLIALPILFLIKCSGVVDDVLGSQFPLNVNNDGNNIKIHINEIKDSAVKVKARYLSGRCTTAHLNAAYTKISYSSDEMNVEFDNEKNKHGIMIFTVPINGGGWCNWELTQLYITPTPCENNESASTSIAVDVLDTDNSFISYDVSLAPVVRKKENKKDEFYYVISNIGDGEISKYRNGEIYITMELKNELLTYSLIDEGIVVFPNGKRVDYAGRSELFFPEFNKIVENSKLKDEVNEK